MSPTDVDLRESGEPASPDPPADRGRWLVLGVLCLALLIVGIDGTIVNVALPHLVRDLGASSSQLQWIVDAYTIIFAGFLLLAGNTGDRLGRKGCFIGGLALFGTGSLLCSRVHTAGALIVFRGLQGFGAAFVMPATLSILTNVFADASERARAIAIWAGVSGLGVALGPLAGGYLLNHAWWGSIFLVNVPIVIVTVIAAGLIVPRSKDEDAPALDLLGTILSTIGLIALLYGVIEGPARGWSDPVIVAMFAGAVVLLGAFVVWERHTDHPILDVSLFANPRFSAASGAVTLVFFAMFGCLFFVSQYLQFVLGYSALQSGVRLLPVAGVLMVAAPLSAGFVRAFGTKLVVAAGLGLVAVALFVFSGTTTSSGYAHVALVLLIIGAGMGLAMAPATDSIMGSVPPERAGVGSAMNDTTREIGGALGVAILGSITNALYLSRITANPVFAGVAAASPQAASAVKSSIGGAAIVAAALPATAARAVTAAANDAFIHALDRTVLVAAAVAVAGALVALAFLPAGVRPATGDAVGDLIVGAADDVLDEESRRGLARATLGLLADAGLSSLTYNAVAARTGIGTTLLRQGWPTKIDAVADAVRELAMARPVPDTGDLGADLLVYVDEAARSMSTPEARRVLGALIREATTDPQLAEALRERVMAPRRAELDRRIAACAAELRVPVELAGDLLIGPVYFRAIIRHADYDPGLARACVAAVLTGSPAERPGS
ncbi:MAG TPA: DHA2 family efflux MFS transporter permease subunit [Acidimicrobiia bacterium]|nr:DHA2 family efflux MFS transporter permease subunit [Acidimicrobiia bacterium]